MTDFSALHRLLAWLSPAFPVGAFSYSHGLEWAVEAGDIHDRVSLGDWLIALFDHGSAHADACFLVHAYRAMAASDACALAEVAELAAAFQPSKERKLETTGQGRAFLDAVEAAWPVERLAGLRAAWDGPLALPVAVGACAAAHGVAEDDALPAYLHAFAANLISAAVRLVPLGQTDGQRALASAEPLIERAAKRAKATPVNAIFSAALRSDIASMRHETQYTRLFRS